MLEQSDNLAGVNLQWADFGNACLYMANFGAADFKNANKAVKDAYYIVLILLVPILEVLT